MRLPKRLKSKVEIDYWHALTADEKSWLRKYQSAYYFRRKKYNEVLTASMLADAKRDYKLSRRDITYVSDAQAVENLTRTREANYSAEDFGAGTKCCFTDDSGFVHTDYAGDNAEDVLVEAIDLGVAITEAELSAERPQSAKYSVGRCVIVKCRTTGTAIRGVITDSVRGILTLDVGKRHPIFADESEVVMLRSVP